MRATKKAFLVSAVVTLWTCVTLRGDAAQPGATRRSSFRFSNADGSQEIEIIRRTRKIVEFKFNRTRKDGCTWQVSATGTFAESSETEGEDGYPIFWDQYRVVSPPARCEMLLGIEEKTAARAQINIGKTCGDTCKFDVRALMTH
jgi:hypothetical protein